MQASRGAGAGGAGGTAGCADAGVGVVIISHNLADVFEVSDFISVLYLGTMVAQLETKQTNYNDVVAYITGIKSDTIPVEVLEEEAVS